MKRKIAGWLAAFATVALLTGCGSDAEVPLNQMKVEKYVTLGDYNNLSVTVDAIKVDFDGIVSPSVFNAENFQLTENEIEI